MFGMSLAEIGVVLVLALVFLGPERLPEVARTLGKTLREVRKAGNMLRDTIMLEEPPKKNLSAPTYEEYDHHIYDDHDDDYHDTHSDEYGLSGTMAHDPHAFSSQRNEVMMSEPQPYADHGTKHVDVELAAGHLGDKPPYDLMTQDSTSNKTETTDVFLHEQLQELAS